jgi:Zn-dependent protease with chaperone function
MPTLTACSHCRAKYTVPESAVGKSAKCAKCGQAFVVAATPASAALAKTGTGTTTTVGGNSSARAGTPVPKATPKATASPPQKNPSTAKPSAPSRLTEQELMASFRAPFEKLRVPLTYRFGILLAAVVMVGLVAIYLGLIALVGYGTYYHAVNHTWIAQMGGGGRARLFMALAYAAPLFVGPVLLFFMIKPLLARPARRERSRSLTRQSEPLLFAFVDRVCETVGAPKPSRIDVDCQVNASAHFRRGVWSMLGKDLVLTIGLPLMGGLTLREFGGVLAHEFAHFAQGAGMRLTYLVQSISHWFLRVVYQRDEWDERLAVLANELDIRIGWVVLLAQLGVMISRGVLWVLMHVGFLVSSILLRQMEFDSDRCQAQFAGTDAFRTAMRKLPLLSAASSLADAQVREHLEERRLVEDLPALVQLNARTVPPDTLAEMEKESAGEKTGWLDTHPSLPDRIAAVEAIGSAGIFHSDRQARELMHDFTAQSKATSWDLYIATFGPKVPREALVPVADFERACKCRWRDPRDSKRHDHYRYQ